MSKSDGIDVLHDTAGVILAGTHAWTGSGFDTVMPRALLPVAHRPLISYSLGWLGEAGITRAAVCGNRETRALPERLARQLPRGMTVSYQEDPMPRGAAGCVHDAAIALDSGTLVVVDGTTVPINVSLRNLLVAHRQSEAAVTIVVTCEARSNGNPGLQVPTGIYVFDRAALASVPAVGFCDIKEKLIPELYRSGQRVVPYRTISTIPRVQGESTYLAVNEWMVEQLVARETPPEGYTRFGSGLIHRDATVADDAVLIGPALIGPGADIGSAALIVGPTSIGCDAIVGAGAMVSRSAVWRRSAIGAGALVDRSILADDVVVEEEDRAFRAVIVPDSRDVRDIVAAATRAAAGATRVRLRPSFGRVAVAVNWSRSPAAQ